MVSAHHDLLMQSCAGDRLWAALQMALSNVASCSSQVLNNAGIISSQGEEPLYHIQTASQKFLFQALRKQ